MNKKVIISEEIKYDQVVGCYRKKVHENYCDITFCKECGCKDEDECEDTRFVEKYRVLRLCDVI